MSDRGRTEANYIRYEPTATILDVATGGYKHVLRNIYPAYYGISPDGRWFIYATYSTPEEARPDWPYRTYDIHLLNLDTLREEKILSGMRFYIGVFAPFSWSPDGRFVGHA